MRRGLLHGVTVVLQPCDLSSYRILLRLVQVNRAWPTILEGTCDEIIGRTPCRLNSSDSIPTEEGFQSVGSALNPSGNRARAVACFCEGQKAEVDIVRGRELGEIVVGVYNALQCPEGPLPPLTTW